MTVPAQHPASGPNDAVSLFAQCFHALADNVERVVKGKRPTVELALTCLFAEGHLLVEDVPGTGKTTLARCLAASLEAEFARVQFTPDLLPSDITGVTVYRQNTGTFDFLPGPVFANVVLGDEINRASPKTQSAMLEVMEERRVTADGRTHPVPRPFMVLATQNSVDMGGTYPLPEAQLDRFLMRVTVGYPDHASEVAVLNGSAAGATPESLSTIASAHHIAEFIQVAQQIQVAEQLYDYIVRITAATRELPDVRLGASPRGSVALARAVRVRAASQGRPYALPEDVKALAEPVLAHRLILTPEAELSGRTGADVVAQVLATVPVPHAGGARV
ncbi:MoxR family ATPase [Streptomyces sp. PTM05]|uniref:MoxR family ATPase n=1 Tax=Streptantibioticus parmotrematis TaxID=2873249 RepID=A0ABS7QZD3_9ACTN|nr:MoxR family ATPase [Streptantibioticus parmotrematis]MBY8888578.1 MoxR family ATPase [Streptantibioticus parmotrematis]